MEALPRETPAPVDNQLILNLIPYGPQLRARLLRILRYKRLQSTNTTAYRLAERGGQEWTVIVAELQTSGRGRLGRRWESPVGGLWFSVVLKPRIEPDEVKFLQFLVANAIVRGIMRASGIQAKVKWPNDLILNSGKLGGILVEARFIQDHVSFAIIGVGVNVNLGPKQLPEGAVSFQQHLGKELDLETLLAHLLESLHSEYAKPWDPFKILAEWWEKCIHRMKHVEIRTQNGIMKGLNTEINPCGHLIIETENRKILTVDEGSLSILGT